MKAFVNSIWFSLLTITLCFLMGYNVPILLQWLFGYPELKLWMILIIIPLGFMAGHGVHVIKLRIIKHYNEPVDPNDK